MNKNALMATVAGGITLFILGGLIYGLLLADFFASDAVSDQPIWWAVTLGQLLSAAFLTVVLDWKGVSSAQEGFQAGAIIGALTGLAFALMMYGTTDGMHHDRNRHRRYRDHSGRLRDRRRRDRDRAQPRCG